MKFKQLNLNISVILLVFLCCVKSAFAQELVEKFHDWSFFKANRGDKEFCYVASVPIKNDGNYNKRGEPFFLVTEIENDADEISTSSGFIYNKNSNVELSFGSKKYYLFPHRSIAWAESTSDDIEIIKEMQKNADLSISGVDRAGKIAVDTYSLIGFTNAYQKMKETCQRQ